MSTDHGQRQCIFSIIVPTFNSAEYLARCLDSVLKQTFREFEILIQDGKSGDRTLEIAASFGDPRIRVESCKDTGVYDAMNRAIARVSGTWILFLGSDDYLFDSTVLEQMENSIANASDAKLVYGNVKISGSNSWATDGEIYRGELTLQELFVHNYCHQAIFYHRAIFNEGHRYNTAYRVCADYDLNLRCAARYKTCYVPIIVSFFATGGLSTQARDPQFEQDKWYNIIRYYGFQLARKSFRSYKKDIRNTSTEFFKRNEFIGGIMALFIWLRHRF